MPEWIKVRGVGRLGVNYDVDPTELPPQFWTSVQNGRFQENAAKKFEGSSPPFGTPSVAPYFVMSTRTPSNIYWLYGGLGAVYATDGNSHKDITKTATTYSATADNRWQGTVHGGVPILNNRSGADVPQQWDLDFGTPGLLTDLSNWPASTYCRSIRSYRNFLVAININSGGADYPHEIRWSHQSTAGAVPSSWDYTDPTVDAGRRDIADTEGHLMDQRVLGDLNILYKEDSIHGMQLIGGDNIFRTYGISFAAGLMNTGCVCDWPKGHALISLDDILIHNGREPTSIVDKRMRKWFFSNIDGDNATRCFAVYHPLRGECWFCFPESGETVPNLALVWNYEDNTLGIRELPGGGMSHAVAGPYDNTVSPDAWDSATASWDSDSVSWGQRLYGSPIPELIGAFPADTKILQFENTNQDDGSNMGFRVERTGLGLVPRTSAPEDENNFIVDLGSIKTITKLRPIMTGTGPVDVYLGSQMHPGDSVSWVGPSSFTPGTDSDVSLVKTGRLMAVAFQSSGNQADSIYGYDLLTEVVADT